MRDTAPRGEGMLGAAEAYASPTSEIRKATAADEPVFPPARFRCHELALPL